MKCLQSKTVRQALSAFELLIKNLMKVSVYCNAYLLSIFPLLKKFIFFVASDPQHTSYLFFAPLGWHWPSLLIFEKTLPKSRIKKS